MKAPTLPEGYRFVVLEEQEFFGYYRLVVRLEKLKTKVKRRFFRESITIDEWVEVYSVNVLPDGDTPTERVFNTMDGLKRKLEEDREYYGLLGEYPPRTEL